jgi:CheY-like chemotaxis protein
MNINTLDTSVSDKAQMYQVFCRHDYPSQYLVIDDEVTVCQGCRKLLTEDGYNVMPAQGGFEGLERAKKEEFDLVLEDLKIPDISGSEAIKKIKVFKNLSGFQYVTRRILLWMRITEHLEF